MSDFDIDEIKEGETVAQHIIAGAAAGTVDFILSGVIVGEMGADGRLLEKEYGYIY